MIFSRRKLSSSTKLISSLFRSFPKQKIEVCAVVYPQLAQNKKPDWGSQIHVMVFYQSLLFVHLIPSHKSAKLSVYTYHARVGKYVSDARVLFCFHFVYKRCFHELLQCFLFTILRNLSSLRSDGWLNRLCSNGLQWSWHNGNLI